MNDPVFLNDKDFDAMYPEYVRQLSRKHWTPLPTAAKAAAFLAQPRSRILDIGSGIGKFCLTAAYHHPDVLFFGVEQRADLVLLAEQAKCKTGLENVRFIHANITQIDFKEFDHFYYYNSFYENIDQVNSIDDLIETSIDLYFYYTQYLYTALQEKPSGTRLVTLQSLEQEIPPDFKLEDDFHNRFLKMWMKP